ncbi:tryptophanyl-tRNA synthetase [Candidatus Gastranaerophilus sp. (ex Termes propinquus)]|nr:tryptophanyl-tRNA synthetase [Candidatus Gastranaerophilus sp. (ex Termes propinquus)]
MTAITDRSRIRRTDPGHPEQCEVVRDYWRIFGAEDEQENLEKQCRKSEIGCMDCKKQLAQKMNETLAPIRARREAFAKDPNTVRDIIHSGSKLARKKAQEVLEQVKTAVRVYL